MRCTGRLVEHQVLGRLREADFLNLYRRWFARGYVRERGQVLVPARNRRWTRSSRVQVVRRAPGRRIASNVHADHVRPPTLKHVKYNVEAVVENLVRVSERMCGELTDYVCVWVETDGRTDSDSFCSTMDELVHTLSFLTHYSSSSVSTKD